MSKTHYEFAIRQAEGEDITHYATREEIAAIPAEADAEKLLIKTVTDPEDFDNRISEAWVTLDAEGYPTAATFDDGSRIPNRFTKR